MTVLADLPLTAAQLGALAQVVMIDLVLAGDNALVVGMAAAGVAPEKRSRVIFWGVACAVGLRVVFALVAAQLLNVLGLTLAGGVLLAWVAWKLWREIRNHRSGGEVDAHAAAAAGSKTLGQAVRQIALADVSMSLDNVLAVAGAAEGHTGIMVAGLLLSVGLMGVAAALIAKALQRHRWIAYAGLAVIAYVALSMIWRGGWEVFHAGVEAVGGI